MKTALLVVDAQNDFFGPDNPNLAVFVRAREVIVQAAALFRERGQPILWINHTSARKSAGSDLWEVEQSFGAADDEPRVVKRHPNAFWESELDGRLCALDVGPVVVCGYVAEYCVLSTLRGAVERGHKAALLAEGVAGFDDAHTRMVFEIEPSVSLGELADQIALPAVEPAPLAR